MSKLYEAITKIEQNHKNSSYTPDFKKKRPPYFLLVVTFLLVLIIVSSAIIINQKVDKIKKVSFAKQDSIVHKVVSNKNRVKNKITLPSKEYGHKKAIHTNQSRKTPTEKTADSVITTVKISKSITHKIDKNKKSAAIKKRIIRKKKKRIAINKIMKQNIYKNRSSNRHSIDIISLIKESKSSDDFRSIAAYRLLIKRFPGNPDLYNNLAIRYIRIHNYKKAIRLLKKALQMKNDPDIRVNLAIGYIKIGDYKKASDTMNNRILMNEKHSRIVEEIDNLLYKNSRQIK